ncbi:MAG: Gfo/Idh/MocA family oxidoreductase [Armatimonadetes bacterium]|nr:Gfo/Idh/MocA family oxidoreductase [Armatimonadota bacterium]
MNKNLSRREFLAASGVAAASFAMPKNVFAAPQTSKLRIGVIGCGGRGTGAAVNACKAAEGVEIVALGDLFMDRVTGCANYIQEQAKDSFNVKQDHMFSGFDAYTKVLQTDCDMVILATPPAFRPFHLQAAIKAGKNVFMEKPVAVDGAGIKIVYEASDLAKEKGLAIVAGTQRRHQNSYRETLARIHDGAIGDVVAMSCYWNQGGLWMHPRQDSWSDAEWQLRNWLYFTWLSGDHICEQHIHNIDVCLWAKQKMPVKAIGHGGRQVRTDPAYGHIFDHFAIEYTFDDGTILHSYCRQQDGTVANVSERIVGTKGTSNGDGRIAGENAFRFDGDNPNPYVNEHTDLIASIRSGNPLNEGRQVANSTLAAIMGRLAAYTGDEITPEEALSTKSTMPSGLTLASSLEVEAVAVPGKTKLVDFS